MPSLVKTTTKIITDTGLMQTALQLIEKSFHKDSNKNVKGGVQFKFYSHGVLITATDGIKIAQYNLREYKTTDSVIVENPVAAEMVVPGSYITSAVKLLKAADPSSEKTVLELRSDKIILYSGDLTIEMQQLKLDDPEAIAQYPDLKKYFPTEFCAQVRFNRKHLIETLKGSDDKYVTFKFSDQQLTLEGTIGVYEKLVEIRPCINIDNPDAKQILSPESKGD